MVPDVLPILCYPSLSHGTLFVNFPLLYIFIRYSGINAS
ncbi:hypothetical protein EMIT048CA2_180002 [Pseudomonas chlororaphis]